MTTASPKTRIQYLRDARNVYAANGADGLRYATPGSVGLDLRACIDADEAEIPAGGRLPIPTGIAVEPLTPGIAGFVYSRSGLGAVQGLTVAQGVGVIDPDYRGEIKVILVNLSNEPFELKPGERIAQLVVAQFTRIEWESVSELSETERGAGGFGSTGRK